MDNVFSLIKRRITLLDYASKFIQFRAYGAKFIGLCPFHSEKTPSFQIDSEKDLFYCFGCQNGGDLFEFYEKFHRVSRKEAVQALANLCGISLSTSKNDHFNKYHFQLTKLKEFFVQNLDSNCRKFLHFRGLSEDSIAKFEIGFAPEKRLILQFLRQENFNFENLGFTSNFWGIFENRIVFPIMDEFGRLCSFGGRVFGQENQNSEQKSLEIGLSGANFSGANNSHKKYFPAKYINGAASENFNKSQILYGANFAKKRQPLFITEGYFDVILLYQNGQNAVAPMGTAFTIEHLKLAMEISQELILAMDGDNAGQNSARKIAYLALENLTLGQQFKILRFPDGEDAASFLQNGGKIENLPKIPLFEFVFHQEIQGLELDKTPEKSAVIFNNLMELAKKIPDPILQQEYRRKWKNLWWTKDRRLESAKIARFHPDLLPILLFKYVVLFPEILDDVAEQFLNLNLPEDFARNLAALLEGQKIDENLAQKIHDLSLKDGIESAKMAVDEWYRIAERFQAEFGQEKRQRVENFSSNFSDQEWEKFKRWLDEKNEKNM